MGELSSDRGADLRHTLDRGEAIEARHQRGPERRRDRERQQRSVEHVAVRSLTQQPALQQSAHQLLDEQRHTIGACKHLLDDRIRQRLALGDADNDAGAIATAEAAQGQRRHMGLVDPGRLEFRPEGDDQQHRHGSGTGNQSIEQVERCRINPVDVLEQDQDGAQRRCAVELVEKRRERHLSLLLRADCQRGVPLVGRQRQQLGDQRHIARYIFSRWLEQGL